MLNLSEPFLALYRSFQQAWRLRWPLLITHLILRLLTIALLLPIIGGLLNFGVAYSGNPALTDQDILWFVLSPAGFIVFLFAMSTMLVMAVLDIVVMTGVLNARAISILPALRYSVLLALTRPTAIFNFAVRFVLRLLALTLPFAAIIGGIAWYFLTEFDINYYLQNQPTDFLIAVFLIGTTLLILSVILVRFLTKWALSVHLILFRNCSAAEAFQRSAEIMSGHRVTLLKQVVAWISLRLVLGTIVTAFVGALAALILPILANNLGAYTAAMLVILSVAAIVDSLVSALATGMLSSLLYALFTTAAGGPPLQNDDLAESVRFPLHSGWVAIAFGLLVVAGIVGGGWLVDETTTEDSVAIIAHRGASAARPENTLASIERAIEDGADWVEIDVQETADGEVVVLHDSGFMKLAGVNLKVWDATMQDLDNIDIGSWFDTTYSDQRTPRLSDVLAMVKGRSRVIIELKYYGHDVDLENRVAEIVDAFQMDSDVAIMSLKYSAVQKFKSLRPDLRAGVLAATAVGNLSRLDADFLAVNQGIVSQRLIDTAQAQGKDVYAWTINDAVTMSSLISRGINGLITDKPELARQVLDYRAEMSTPERLMLWFCNLVGLNPVTPKVGELRP